MHSLNARFMYSRTPPFVLLLDIPCLCSLACLYFVQTTVYSWSMPVVHIMHSWDMPVVHIVHSWDMPVLRIMHSWDMPVVHIMHSWDMPVVHIMHS